MSVFEVSSTVDFDFDFIKSLEENAVKALEQTADALLTEVKNAEVMPKVTGKLQNESTFVDDTYAQNGKVSIVSSTPYARRLYFHPEYNFDRSDNSAAGAHWFRYWLPGGTRQNFCAEKFKEIYRRLCGL
ncbi:MAG: hypothetical protein UIH27_14325 [Ruminococcus sp.]|nr:hypothetical protein [Ruminococcus sp.]